MKLTNLREKKNVTGLTLALPSQTSSKKEGGVGWFDGCLTEDRGDVDGEKCG